MKEEGDGETNEEREKERMSLRNNRGRRKEKLGVGREGEDWMREEKVREIGLT